MGYLKLEWDGRPVGAVELDRSIVIGRGSGCDILVNDAQLSRRHLSIGVSAEGWVATDLHSSNGTFVDGRRINRQVLEDGQVIRFGGVNLTFYEERPPTAEAADTLPLRIDVAMLAAPKELEVEPIPAEIEPKDSAATDTAPIDIAPADVALKDIAHTDAPPTVVATNFRPKKQRSLMEKAGVSEADIKSREQKEALSLRVRLNRRLNTVPRLLLISLGAVAALLIFALALELSQWVLN